jgi:hypothetical protein
MLQCGLFLKINLRCKEDQHNDTQHNDSQPNDTQHNSKKVRH